MEQTTKTPEMPAEQASELAALNAAANEGANVATASVEDVAPAVNLAGEIKALVLAFVAIAEPIFPSLTTIYTDETAGAAADAVAALCDKHGWAQNGLMGDYGEEVAAAIVLLPIGFATAQGIKVDLANNKAKQQKQIQAPGDEKAVISQTQAKPDESLQGWQPPGANGANS